MGREVGIVQHIYVKNVGSRATFRATITTDVAGLDKAIGRSAELAWENPQAATKHLGQSEEGRLRVGACELNESGHVEFWLFAMPEFRHQEQSGYLPTQRYMVTGESLDFDLCVRNVEADLAYHRHARMTFGSDGRPMLELQTSTVPLLGTVGTFARAPLGTTFTLVDRPSPVVAHKFRASGLANP